MRNRILSDSIQPDGVGRRRAAWIILLAVMICLSLLAYEGLRKVPLEVAHSSPSPSIAEASFDAVQRPLIADAGDTRTQVAGDPSPDPEADPEVRSYVERIPLGDNKWATYSVRWKGTTKQLLYDSGRLHSEGVWLSSRQEGMHRLWHPNGQLHSEGEWKSGRQIGLHRFYNATGVLLAVGEYVGGWRAGPWTEWYEDGMLKSQGSYGYPSDQNPSMREGFWEYWHPDGSRDSAKTGVYMADSLIKE